MPQLHESRVVCIELEGGGAGVDSERVGHNGERKRHGAQEEEGGGGEGGRAARVKSLKVAVGVGENKWAAVE